MSEATFQVARKVERPKVNRAAKDSQLVTDLLPQVEAARDEQVGIVLATNDAKGLRRALRKAGRSLPDGAVTIRFAAGSAAEGEGEVTFYTAAVITRKPKDTEQAGGQTNRRSRRSS